MAGNEHLPKTGRGTAGTWHVVMKRSVREDLPKNPWDKKMEWIEQAKASIRAKVEHLFHVVKNLFRHRNTLYRGLDKNAKQLFTLFGLANLVLARKW